MGRILTDLEKRILREIVVSYPVCYEEVENVYKVLIRHEDFYNKTKFDNLIWILENSLKTGRSLDYYINWEQIKRGS